MPRSKRRDERVCVLLCVVPALLCAERLTAPTPVRFQLKHSHQQPYSLLRLHPDLPINTQHCFYLPFARGGGKSVGGARQRKREPGMVSIGFRMYWNQVLIFFLFFPNGKKCIVRLEEISMGIWGKRSWNEHPAHRCLLWIVYRSVVIELSERGPSPICALLRVFWPVSVSLKYSTSESLESSVRDVSKGALCTVRQIIIIMKKNPLLISTLLLNSCCKSPE